MKDHGGDIYSFQEKTGITEFIDFSANISPLGVPESILNAYVSAIDRLSYYPDPENRVLTEAVCRFHNIPPETVICGNGGADVIYRTVRTLSPKNALVLVPTFSEYRDALEECSCRVSKFFLRFPFDIDDSFIEHIYSEKYDIVVLCNPNNPTGTLAEPDMLVRIADAAKAQGSVFLLDECFTDMLCHDSDRYSLIPGLGEYPNLVIIKSLTKMFSIPGLRLGYGICSDPVLASRIRKCGQPWPVNIPASEVGAAALADYDYRKRFIDFISREREFLYSELKSIGLEVWKPSANFIFFRAEGYPDLDTRLADYGILIRSCSNYSGLDEEYFRVSVRLREENIHLINSLKSVFGTEEL